MSLSVMLAACGSQPSNTREQAGATLAPVAPTAASSVDAGLAANALAKPIASSELPAIRPLNGNPEPDSYAYREDARQLAIELAQSLELDPIWVWETLAKAKVKDNAAKLMMPAPVPTAKNWAVYRSRFVEPIRIKAGVNFWHIYEADLKRAENQYGVPAAIIAGVLGVETIYGKNTGNFRVLDVLMTLTLDFPKGRSDRSAFFKDELGQFLKLCQEQGTAPDSMLGSYAGAVGLPQFMPSSIRRYAVDFDGDGHIDLMRSPVDAIGSVAHYLAEHGWQTSLPTYYDIAPPRDTSALTKLLAPDILPSFSVKEMQELGANLSPSAQNHPGPLALVQLFNGQNTPTMIAGTANFYAITRYNQSSYYALAVIQLGDAVSREAARQNDQNP